MIWICLYMYIKNIVFNINLVKIEDIEDIIGYKIIEIKYILV